MKKVMKSLLEPNKIIGFLVFNISIGLLIYIFTCRLEYTPLAYISYLLSTYALIIFCIWFYKACKFSNHYIKENSKFYKLYNNNSRSITKIVLYFSLSINLIYGIFKLLAGIYYKSEWFITFAIYYLLLCFMKSSLAFGIKNDKFEVKLKKEYKKLKNTGIVLLFLDLVLSGMIVLIIHQNQIIYYPGYLIYIVALYDFYLIISAFVNVIKYRKQKSPILIANKCINLTVAMISMISLEVAMIYQFGSNDSDFKLIMTSVTGLGVCIINSFMAIYMIIKSNEYLKINI